MRTGKSECARALAGINRPAVKAVNDAAAASVRDILRISATDRLPQPNGGRCRESTARLTVCDGE
jgi:hypothetical protein